MGLCRACMHSFFIDCHSLRELRITSVLMIAAIQKRDVGRIQVQRPCEFFLREEVFQIQHMRIEAEKYKLFLVKEAEREKMLAEEAKEQLAKKSEEADRARMAKAEKDWQELQGKSRQKMFRWGHQPSAIGQSKLT